VDLIDGFNALLSSCVSFRLLESSWCNFIVDPFASCTLVRPIAGPNNCPRYLTLLCNPWQSFSCSP
jgi:hypothetical protein